MKIMRYDVYHPSKEKLLKKESLVQKADDLRWMLKTDSKNLVYYRLYITCALAPGFLFDLDQSNAWRDIQETEQSLSIRISLPIPQKIYSITKRSKASEGVDQHFPAGFLAFIDCK